MKSYGVCASFFLSWLLCGCSVDKALDDPRAFGVLAVALMVCVVSAWLITGGDD